MAHSGKSATLHLKSMTRSSIVLLILTPFFLFTVGPIIGSSHAEVTAYFARPFPALITAAMLIVGLLHFKGGVQTLIEDYVASPQRERLINLMTLVSYGLMAVGLLALALMLF